MAHFRSLRPVGHYGVPGCVRIALEGLWGYMYWVTSRGISERGEDSAGVGKSGNKGIKPAAPYYHTGREVWSLVSLDKNKKNKKMKIIIIGGWRYPVTADSITR